MAYKLRYQVSIDFVGAGAGPMEALSPAAGQMLPGGGSTGQSKSFVGNPASIPIVAGAGTGNALASADITALLASLSADMSTQMNAAIATMQGWVSGNP
jgi:hypothetical protein